MPRDRSRAWIDVLVIRAGKAVVRKTIFRDDERVAAKYGLSVDCEWVLVPEATVYPNECILPITVLGVAGSDG